MKQQDAYTPTRPGARNRTAGKSQTWSNKWDRESNSNGGKPQHRLGIESISYIKTLCREGLHDGSATAKRMPQYYCGYQEYLRREKTVRKD